MGRGIIDYLVRASMDARITSDGSGVVTLGTRSYLGGRPWLFFTGHWTYHCSIEQKHDCGMGAIANRVDSMLVTAREK